MIKPHKCRQDNAIQAAQKRGTRYPDDPPCGSENVLYRTLATGNRIIEAGPCRGLVMQRFRLSIDIHPDLGKNSTTDETSILGPRSDQRARWLKFADCALHRHGASEEDIAELTELAREEQETIKRHIRRSAHVVKKQSRSKH